MKNSTKNILVAGLGGIAVGALAGILFAPASGKETREAIKSKTTDLSDEVSNKINALKGCATETDPAEIIADLKAKVAAKFKSGKSEVKDNLLEQIQTLEEAIKKA
ncbi:YtxH domain-containing protein [Crocinitomix algicola]|uniref:YtxH domain-containing protein n=1 Tax=Crocinitomix algicola TaxID=1740263 RepID=UPI00082A4A6F|nr:YtxH domain-containing protein [Crocinitomix algicola]